MRVLLIIAARGRSVDAPIASQPALQGLPQQVLLTKETSQVVPSA